MKIIPRSWHEGGLRGVREDVFMEGYIYREKNFSSMQIK
jgi:hypothetical protein